MKKLILLLTLTMMFGQTKLETRAYETDVNLNNGMVDIRELTNTNLTHYSVQILPPINNTGGSTCVFHAYYGSSGLIYNLGSTGIGTSNGTFAENIHINSELDSEIYFSMYSNTVCEVTPLKFWVTAEFPQEDTGYIEDGFDYCVEPGQNLMSYPCDSSVALLDAIPSDALSQFSGIIGQGVAATNLNGMWVGSIINLSPGSGYSQVLHSALTTIVRRIKIIEEEFFVIL